MRVEDRVAVALLGEEPLAVLREVLVDGVARDERVEVRREADSFGRSRRPRRCASSWREPNEPDTWIATVASGRSTEKFATFETTSTGVPAVAELLEQPLALVDGRRAR